MTETYGFGMYGMYGPVTDPGEREFTEKVRALGVNVGESPYRDYEVSKILASIVALPSGSKIILWGSSLGANNCPVVAVYVARSLPHLTIAGMWGFQASDFGARAKLGTGYEGIPANVLFAHEVYNPNKIMTAGFGAYEWELAPGNHRTNLYLSARYDFHPGETEAAQAMFLAEMKRVIA